MLLLGWVITGRNKTLLLRLAGVCGMLTGLLILSGSFR
jgi:hypothetical protein